MRDDLRAAIAPHFAEPIVAVEVVYRAGRGDVVEARTASGERGLFVVQDGVARMADDIERRIDAMPTPEDEAPATTAVAAPPAPQAPPTEEPRKRALFGRKNPDAQQPADEKPKKRFGFGKRS